MKTLVVGRGLLGRHVVAAFQAGNRHVETVDVPWQDPEAALSVLVDAARRTADGGAPWQLVWSAGAGVVATPEEALRSEVEFFRALVSHLPAVPDAVFLASSVGAAYGASQASAPYTEESPTGALSPYGLAKLEMERVAASLSHAGSRILLARIANLFGPGQNLSKPQGLVSQICLAQCLRQPLPVYASMDTLRDYLFAPDAGEMVIAALDRLLEEPAGTSVIKIFASGRAVSIGMLVGEATRLFRRRPRLALGRRIGPASDLRVRSLVWPELDAVAHTPLVVGLDATARDIVEQLASGSLAPVVRR